MVNKPDDFADDDRVDGADEQEVDDMPSGAARWAVIATAGGAIILLAAVFMHWRR
jgi:hypothetical protein